LIVYFFKRHYLFFLNNSISTTAKANRLIHEKSPYLLQHAYNPVDWFPWGAEAFEKAKKENKPIFLSIGYSTCHWCHVMEHESFENPGIAKILNEHFVSIKIDREERPDLDQIYMTATQAVTGSGGWPMSVWLNHKLEPFYTGTYFPPESRFGRPGFADVLLQLHQVWEEQPSKINQSASKITDVLKQITGAKPETAVIPKKIISEAYDHFANSFDHLFGGFGNAPKFPRAVQFPFLFRYYFETGEGNSLNIALFTLRRMAQGGMYDQLGGGFHRYSVDVEWRVPHFEKMLYDNAQLLSTYTEAWQLTHESFFEEIARDIIRYVARDMTAPGGAFFSAEDADSEGEEGTFYVWTQQEVEKIIGPKATEIISLCYNFRPDGNFEHGKNVLHRIYSTQEIAHKLGKSPEEIQTCIEEAKAKLFEARLKRPRPHLDDKIITAWNGLMIGGMAKAARVFGEKEFLERASKAAEFVLAHLYDSKTKRLLRRFRDGEARGNGFLDDYSFFISGLLELFESSQDPRWLTEAIRLMDEQIQFFWDTPHGGFYFARADDPTLLIRPKSDYEGAEPSGNSVSTINLLRLSQLTDSKEYRQKAEQTLKAVSSQLTQFPVSMPLMLCAYLDSVGKPSQIIIAESNDPNGPAMWNEVNQNYLPNTTLIRIKEEAKQRELAKHIPSLANMKIRNEKSSAFICRDFVCQTPIHELKDLKEALETIRKNKSQ
jgi:uncharacterized protein